MEWTEADDALLHYEGLDPHHPACIATIFINGLRARLPAHEIGTLVTPESRPDWGDFFDVYEVFGNMPNPATNSIPKAAAGAPDVVYIGVFSDVPESFQVHADGFLVVNGVFTMIWRPETPAGWLIHAYGHYLLPEELPRSSPGTAPTF